MVNDRYSSSYLYTRRDNNFRFNCFLDKIVTSNRKWGGDGGGVGASFHAYIQIQVRRKVKTNTILLFFLKRLQSGRHQLNSTFIVNNCESPSFFQHFFHINFNFWFRFSLLFRKKKNEKENWWLTEETVFPCHTFYFSFINHPVLCFLHSPVPWKKYWEQKNELNLKPK